MNEQTLTNLATVTLTEDDTPVISLLRGHHTIEVFNQAFKKEGWHIEVPWAEDDISHEFWVEESDGVWVCSNKFNSRAVPVTIANWYPVDPSFH